SSLEEEQPTTLSIVYYLQIYHKKLQEQYSPMGSLGMPTFFSSLSGYFHESYHSKLKRTSSYSHGLIGKAFFLLILLSFLIFNTFFISFSNYFFFESRVELCFVSLISSRVTFLLELCLDLYSGSIGASHRIVSLDCRKRADSEKVGFDYGTKKI